MTTTTEMPRVEVLRKQWNDYQNENRRAFRYDAARAFGVSEAELLAIDCGGSVTRLMGDWRELLGEFHRLGRVMALTRNAHAVHEKKGQYAPVSFQEHVGLVLDPNIDLRLFMKNWALGFSVFNPESKGMKRSFQFFDAAGTSAHKVFVGDEGAGVFDELTAQFHSANQSAAQTVSAPAVAAIEKADDQIDAVALQEAWAGLQDTHDFFPLLKRFGVGRTQAHRLAGTRFAERLQVTAYRDVLQKAAGTELPIMVFVGNAGCIQIHSGPVRKVVELDRWFNVMDPDFNLHLSEAGVAEVWLTRKPTRDGVVTCVELFDDAGKDIAFIFGKRKPGIPELKEWRSLAESLPRKAEGRR